MLTDDIMFDLIGFYESENLVTPRSDFKFTVPPSPIRHHLEGICASLCYYLLFECFPVCSFRLYRLRQRRDVAKLREHCERHVH